MYRYVTAVMLAKHSSHVSFCYFFFPRTRREGYGNFEIPRRLHCVQIGALQCDDSVNARSFTDADVDRKLRDT